MRRFARGVMAAVLALQAGAAGPAASQPTRQLDEALLRDRIVAGDVLGISVFPGEEYSREVTVQPDGKIQMPLIGTVMARGQTVESLQALLEKRLSRYLDKPQVTINVRRFSGRKISIIGEVRSPGYYDFRDGMTLLELVSLAGGLGPDARAARVKILRTGEDKSRSFTVNFQAVLDGDLSRDPLIAPGDTIFIPKQPFTEGAAWVNRNILPWATIASIIATVIVATRR